MTHAQCAAIHKDTNHALKEIAGKIDRLIGTQIEIHNYLWVGGNKPSVETRLVTMERDVSNIRVLIGRALYVVVGAAGTIIFAAVSIVLWWATQIGNL